MLLKERTRARAIACWAPFFGFAYAEPVLWTARGEVTTVQGSFAGSGVQANALVEIRMTYDDEAVEDELKNALGNVENDFRTDLNLTIEIKTGGHTWSGRITSGSNSAPYTLFTRLYNLFPGPEVFEANVDANDGADFALFPYASEAANKTLSLRFSGPNTFLGAGIQSFDIDPSSITSATGVIRSGSTSNQIQFTIDPATVSVIDLADEPVAPTIKVNTPGSDFELKWSSDPRFNYRLEKSLSLASQDWVLIENLSGTGATITRQFPRGNATTFYRIVAVSKPR